MLKSVLRTALRALLPLAILAALASPASAQSSVRYEATAAPDLYTAANYMGLSAQEFVDTSVAVHSFLLAVSGKTDEGGGCGQYEPLGDSGTYVFNVNESQPLTNVMSYYCFTESEAAFASTTLLVWLTALDANLRGVERVPVTPPLPKDPADPAPEDDQPVEGEGNEDPAPKTYPDCTLGPATATPGTEPVTWTITMSKCPTQGEGIDLPGDDHCAVIGQGSAQVISWISNLLTFSCSSDPAVVWQRAAAFLDDCGQAVSRDTTPGRATPYSIRLVDDPDFGPALWEMQITLDAGGFAEANDPERATKPDACATPEVANQFCNQVWGSGGSTFRSERVGHAWRLGAIWSNHYFQCIGSNEYDASAFCDVTVHNEDDPFSITWVGFVWPEFTPSDGDPATCASEAASLTIWNGESICSIFGAGMTPEIRPDRDTTSTGTDVSTLVTYGCK